MKHHDLHLSMFLHQALALHAEWVASMPKPGDGAALQISGVSVVEDVVEVVESLGLKIMNEVPRNLRVLHFTHSWSMRCETKCFGLRFAYIIFHFIHFKSIQKSSNQESEATNGFHLRIIDIIASWFCWEHVAQSDADLHRYI